ncbi:MAG: hypothetical protein VB039_08705 [Oscillospiraceae bacterium]|nr:hypothetical protein [Oscillospiraceae bacterium]
MRKRLCGFILALFPALLLCACGEAPAEPTSAPETPAAEFVLTDESADEILALADIPELEYVDGRQSHEYAALLELYGKRPDCRVIWTYKLGGTVYPSDTRELRVTELEGLEDALRYLPELSYVDLIDSPAVLEDMDRFSAIRPDIFYYWSFVHDGFTIRTDIQCYSTLRDADYHRFTSEELYPLLKYCKKLKALDLGHNDVTDLTLIGKLTELEVLILADNPNLVDTSPLKELSNLIYLEFFLNDQVEDFSFLDSLPRLRDLNLCYCSKLDSLSFLENMPEISFCMLKFCGVSGDELDYWRGRYPETNFVTYDGNVHSCDSGWRDTQRNRQIRYAFTNWRHVTDYRRYDDVDFNFDGYNY